MKVRRIIASITLVCTIVFLHGCYSGRMISRPELEENRECTISAVVTTDGYLHEFQRNAFLVDSVIIGTLKDGGMGQFPLSDVKMVYIKVFNPVTSCLAVIGVSTVALVAISLIVLATKESCPFVYSFDGERYIFDGEPYGGAICKGLQRKDICRLEHLRPIGGEYRIQLTNEVNETQYTDEFKLWVVDHPPEVDVVQDAGGNLYTVAGLHKPVTALDMRGNNLDNWVSEKDMLFWESNMTGRDPKSNSDLRDTLLLTFLRPNGDEQAKLAVCGCNTLWASQMLMRMVALCGRHVGRFYGKMNDPTALTRRDDLANWSEIYALNVEVWANGEWTRRGKIIGGGPFIAEERIVPLNLEGVEGDTVKIRLAPPVGFWQFNSFAMDYSTEVPFEMQEISARSIIANDGEDICSVLESTDMNHYVVPDVGQYAVFVFPVPEAKGNKERVVFAKVSGYYEMHLNISGTPELEKLNRILSERDYVVRFSLEEYAKWCREYALR